MFYLQDLRYACRQLARKRAYTMLTIVVLAGGLAVSIFTFSFLYTALLKPLPVPDGGQIVRVMQIGSGRTIGLIDAADLAAVRQGGISSMELGAFTDVELIIGTDQGTRTISATASEWNIFEVTRTSPLMGRRFTANDQAPGAEPVVVLTYSAWQTAFGGDATILDTLVRLNGVPTRVVGVMPRGFGFPVATDAYVPIRSELLTATVRGVARLQAFARLAPGVDAARASAELTALLQRAYSRRPPNAELPQPSAMTLQSFQMAQVDGGPIVLIVLNALAALILMLACVNVTNLLLARANERARETAVRLALGASSARLIVQTTWESVVLTVAGGTLATALAIWALDAVNGWAQATLPGNLAFWWVWGYDPSVLVAAAAFVALAIVVLAAVATRRAVNTEISTVLQEGAARASSRAEGRFARALVVGQVVALSLLMFFGALSGLVAYRFVNVDFGYDTRNLLTATLVPPADRYPSAAERSRLFQSVLDGIGERPEIDGALIRLMLAHVESAGGVLEISGDNDADSGRRPHAHVVAALGSLTPLGVELAAGRFFTAEDDDDGAKTALVSRAMAELYWPDRSPLGEQLTLTGIGESEPRTVVGIVGDVVLGGPVRQAPSSVGVYIPLQQTQARAGTVTLRHGGDEQDARAAYHETMTTLDPLVVSEVRSFEDELRRSTALATSVTRLLAGCLVFALMLAVSGTYGLMVLSIGRRTRELGVRRALGASDGRVLAMLLGQGAKQLGIGALIALPLLLAIGWVFSLALPVAFSTSIVVALAVSAAIALIVLAATWIPTRRAIAIAPRDALWRE